MANTNYNIDVNENKTTFYALLAYADNRVLDTALTTMVEGEDGVILMCLATGEYAVLDRSQEGVYLTYMFRDEESARRAFEACIGQWE